MATKTITIVGGGLAGLTLGISLRQAGVSVVVREAHGYPRHRVCGEFLSGKGLRVLEQIGLLARLKKTGGFEARSVGVYSGRSALSSWKLASPALAISRHVFDATLATAFTEAGGELYCHCRCAVPTEGSGMVRATGRQAHIGGNDRLVGLKAHFESAPLQQDLELHLFPRFYIGLCRLGSGVNVCGLFRLGQGEKVAPDRIVDLLRGPANSVLRSRLETAAVRDESICATAGLPLPGIAPCWQAGVIGDSLAFLPPFTGNGMSLAIESGAMASKDLIAYAKGLIDWNQAWRRILASFRAAFYQRLILASTVNRVLFSRFGPGALRVSGFLPRIFQVLYRVTR